MEQVAIEAQVRKVQGKGASHKLRREGLVPGVIYSRGGDNVMVQVHERELVRILSTRGGENVLVNLKIDGKPTTAVISEVQRDIYQKHMLHVDFHRVSMDEVIHTAVNLVFRGPSAAEREGAMVDQIRHEIDVEATPNNLPREIEVDVTSLGIGQTIHVRDLKLPAGVKAITDGDEMVVVVHAARTQEESPAASAADATLGAATPA